MPVGRVDASVHSSHRLSNRPVRILAHLLALMHIGQRDRPETTVGLIDLALGERHNVHLHPQLAVRVVGEPWMLERDADCLFGAVGEADADDDHVERDRDDGRDLDVRHRGVRTVIMVVQRGKYD